MTSSTALISAFFERRKDHGRDTLEGSKRPGYGGQGRVKQHVAAVITPDLLPSMPTTHDTNTVDGAVHATAHAAHTTADTDAAADANTDMACTGHTFTPVVTPSRTQHSPHAPRPREGPATHKGTGAATTTTTTGMPSLEADDTVDIDMPVFTDFVSSSDLPLATRVATACAGEFALALLHTPQQINTRVCTRSILININTRLCVRVH